MQIDTDTIYVDLRYPRSIKGAPTKVVVALEDVRAADDLTISYDFDHDGWSITREIKRQGDGFMEATGTWVEVAFVSAWTEAPDA